MLLQALQRRHGIQDDCNNVHNVTIRYTKIHPKYVLPSAHQIRLRQDHFCRQQNCYTCRTESRIRARHTRHQHLIQCTAILTTIFAPANRTERYRKSGPLLRPKRRSHARKDTTRKPFRMLQLLATRALETRQHRKKRN